MGKGLGIASLVTGILAFPFSAIGWILATVAIITGVMARKRSESRTLGTIGMILGIVWWILALLGVILMVIGILIGAASIF